jgi:hypothetical protein
MNRSNNSTVIAHRIGKLMRAARKATGVVAWLKACELFKIDPKLPLSEELFEAEVKKFDSAFETTKGDEKSASRPTV